MKKQERTAIEAVVRRLGGNPADFDIAILKRHGGSESDSARPRLRFDKVVMRLMEDLRAAAGEIVPDGTTVLVTVTAPIRLPAKTAVAVEDKIRTLLARGSGGRDAKETIHGNAVRIRVWRNERGRAPKLIGFVHNPHTDPVVFFNMTTELLDVTARRTPKLAGDRWLVVISSRGVSCLEAYRYIYSQLGTGTRYKKVVMVFRDGNVETLAE